MGSLLLVILTPFYYLSPTFEVVQGLSEELECHEYFSLLYREDCRQQRDEGQFQEKDGLRYRYCISRRREGQGQCPGVHQTGPYRVQR